MISPDVLKQSATAGIAGLAVASGLFFATMAQGDVSEARIDMSTPTETIEISFESAEQVNVPCEKPTRQRAQTDEARADAVESLAHDVVSVAASRRPTAS